MTNAVKMIAALFVVTIFAFSGGNAQAAGDPVAGEKVFKKCKQCHMVGENAKRRQGPVLNGVVGRAAGTVEGYRYSKPLLAKAAEGLVWDKANLGEYLKAPRKFIPRGKMSFGGLKTQEEIDNVIAYMAQFE
jgi:cytochrome c